LISTSQVARITGISHRCPASHSFHSHSPTTTIYSPLSQCSLRDFVFVLFETGRRALSFLDISLQWPTRPYRCDVCLLSTSVPLQPL
jgi:hypothetical protein